MIAPSRGMGLLLDDPRGFAFSGFPGYPGNGLSAVHCLTAISGLPGLHTLWRGGGAWRGDQDHLGRPIPYRPRVPERLKIADQDRDIHESHEMRARAARLGCIPLPL